MGHLLKLALMGSDVPGRIDATLTPDPSAMTGYLRVNTNGSEKIAIQSGTASISLFVGDSFSAVMEIFSNSQTYMNISSNKRGTLYSETNTGGSLVSGIYTAVDEEIITITASYVI